ncbi:MAG: hypothetical protein Q8M16_09480 [Pirellulaceae bacterium]|nr:hypothetical protein [Pirellulaceae bacterium]
MISSLLKLLARLRLPLWFGWRVELAVGEQAALDAAGSLAWREYATTERLFEAWSPAADSLWEAYHCPTLFAALDQIPTGKVGVAPEVWIPEWLRTEVPAPSWLDAQTWLILDGPPLASIAMAAHLCYQQVCQPVCTFDNWPHPSGLLKSEVALAGLIRYAPLMAQARSKWHKGLPPVWICDSGRLGFRPGRPKDFDNRYYLDDSILPGIELLRQHQLQRVVYASVNVSDPPTADIAGYLHSLQKQGLPVLRIGLASREAWDSGPVPAGELPAPVFSTQGFFRSTAGGFGTSIPEPSSSSG